MPRADLSRLHAVIPLRGLEGGKQRLGDALDAEERETLLLGMLLHEIEALGAWSACEAVHVVTADERVRPLVEAAGASVVLESPAGGGLNAALRLGRDAAARAGASAVLILPGDLPFLEVAALERLLDAADAAVAAGAGRAVVVAAPSDARGGTNALLLAPVDVIEPRFGPQSLEAHVRAAAEAQASVQLVADPALGFDLDTTDDLERIEPGHLARLIRLGERRMASAAG